MTTEYENRFRDPEFIAIWQRWQDARNMWRKAWKHIPFECFTNDRDIYNPDPERVHTDEAKAATKEFIEARAAYKAKIASYPED